jgi:hypothetical protein
LISHGGVHTLVLPGAEATGPGGGIMDKQSTIARVEKDFAELLQVVEGLDEAAMSKRFYDAWSAKDVLAHIAGWHTTMVRAMERMARGEKPTAEGEDYSDSDGWNARFASAMAPQNATTVVAALRQSFANYVRAAQAIPDERYGEGKTINRLLETSGYGHYAEHLPALREYRTSLGAG